MAGDKTEEKPSRHVRPKSAGTINLLVETRRKASHEYQRAQRAERSYRMHKNATIARERMDETKTDFKEGFSHLGNGIKGLFAVVCATPDLVGERREISRQKSEAKERERAEGMRKKLDEKLAGKYASDDDEAPAKNYGEKSKSVKSVKSSGKRISDEL
ncbi:hypothetical protein F5Y09DRAFT_279589 [Xylaria sp. FL1042]|nr:hypothetical protein F5Y09DRAFT_279589 [Xylaria sp. FL1042]